MAASDSVALTGPPWTSCCYVVSTAHAASRGWPRGGACLVTRRLLGDAAQRLFANALLARLGLARSGDHASFAADSPITQQARDDGTTAVQNLLLGIPVVCCHRKCRSLWNHHRHFTHSHRSISGTMRSRVGLCDACTGMWACASACMA